MKTLLLFLLAMPFISYGQQGSPDVTFGNNGIVITDINNLDDYAYGLAEAPDGRILALTLGQDQSTGDSFWKILAFTENGDIDLTFSEDGYIELLEPNSYAYSLITSQSDGKILYNSESYTTYKIFRLRPNGTLDADFGIAGEVVPFPETSSYNRVIPNADDSFFVIAKFEEGNAETLKIKKFFANGIVDVTYGTDGVTTFELENDTYVYQAHITESNNLLINYRLNNSSQNLISRYLPDGTLDAAFGSNGVVIVPIDEYWSCQLFPLYDESILVSASHFGINDIERKSFKLDPSGTIDQSFANNGFLEDFVIQAIQHNQRIIAENSIVDFEGGRTLSYYRFFPNGAIDSSFNFEYNYTEIGSVYFLFDRSGKILIASSDIWYNFPINLVLFRYNNDALETEDFFRTKFSVYPNPFSGIFNVVRASHSENDSYDIFDITGKIIGKGQLIDTQTQIDLSSAQSGVYFLKTNNGVFRLLKN